MSARFNDRRWLWRGIERVATAGGWPARLAVPFGFPADVVVEHHDVVVPSAAASGRILRLAFASDFHVGPSTPTAVIDGALRQLRGVEVDLLLLGGDFVSQKSEYARDLATAISTIPAPLGRYAVLGNHDHWSGANRVAEHLEDAGVVMLTNRNVRLADPFGAVSLCGIDDHSSGLPDAAATFAGAAPIRILLMHNPSGLLDVGDHDFTVALCGHTHGGQVAMPDGRPIKVAHGALTRRYNAGRFDLGRGRTMIVSRGVGCSTFPVRFNAPPAVMTVHLEGTSRRA